MKVLILLLITVSCFGQIDKKKAFLLLSSAAEEPAYDYAQDGEDYLVSSARTFHDFTQQSGAHGATISTNDDLTSNNRDLTNNPGGLYTTGFPLSPTVFNFRFPDISTAKTLYPFNNNPLLFANNTTNAIFATSHEIHISLSARSKNFAFYLFGVNSTQVHYAQINTDGKISIFIKRAASTTHLRTVASVFTQSIQNGDLGNVMALRFRYDFTTPACKVYLNTAEIATELVTGTAVASWDSGYSWNNLYSFAVGAYAQATNTIGSTKPSFIHKFAVTPLLSQDDANNVTHCMLSTPAQSGDEIILADFRMPLTTASKSFAFSVYLKESATETVSISGSNVTISDNSLDFTPSDYNVPQLVKLVGDDNYGYQIRDISIGSKTKQVVLAESRTGVGGKDGSDVYLTDGWNAARKEAYDISIPSAATLRDDIKTTLFKGDYPSGAANSSSTVTAYAGITLTNASAATITNFMFRDVDEDAYQYDNNVAYVRNSSPNNKLFIQLFGHGESFHQEMYNSVIALGYDWAGACLAFAVANTENNPNLTGSPSWLAHDQLFTAGVDTETFDARRLFFHDKIRFLDYILTQHSYDEIIVAGVSGGGWAATMWASFDNRIDKVFNVRGANSYNHPESGSDFEQGPSFLTENFGGAAASEAVCGPRVTDDYRNLGYLKRMALICANGAEYHQISHELDPLGGAYYNQIPLDIMQQKATQLGGSFFVFVNTNAGESTHGFNTSDRQYILDNL